MKLIKTMMMAASVALIAAPMALPTAATAQEFPLVGGQYSDITGITVKDGGGLAYASYLADQWVKNQEFAKSQGWITDYRIYANVNGRDGEPDLYLVVTYPSVPDAAEGERRSAAYRAWAKKTETQLAAENGNRAEFRTVRGSMMLQEWTKR